MKNFKNLLLSAVVACLFALLMVGESYGVNIGDHVGRIQNPSSSFKRTRGGGIKLPASFSKISDTGGLGVEGCICAGRRRQFNAPSFNRISAPKVKTAATPQAKKFHTELTKLRDDYKADVKAADKTKEAELEKIDNKIDAEIKAEPAVEAADKKIGELTDKIDDYTDAKDKTLEELDAQYAKDLLSAIENGEDIEAVIKNYKETKENINTEFDTKISDTEKEIATLEKAKGIVVDNIKKKYADEKAKVEEDYKSSVSESLSEYKEKAEKLWTSTFKGKDVKASVLNPDGKDTAKDWGTRRVVVNPVPAPRNIRSAVSAPTALSRSVRGSSIGGINSSIPNIRGGAVTLKPEQKAVMDRMTKDFMDNWRKKVGL